MNLTKDDLQNLDARFRANLVNSVTGYKPANLIGTIAARGQTNLAMFTSVVHLGANPPLIGFIQRPTGETPRHTYENILETGVYTINHVHEDFVRRAHWTSAKFERGVSEFEKCGLSAEFVEGFAAPFVAESRIKLGLRFVERIPIKLNGTTLVVGEIIALIVPENAVSKNGSVDLNAAADVAVSGLDTYHRVAKIDTLPYAKPENMPEFR
jgi:flavin reductase (DIM6/NTAB) family NADH-FMN oxidoreductase RutF